MVVSSRWDYEYRNCIAHGNLCARKPLVACVEVAKTRGASAPASQSDFTLRNQWLFNLSAEISDLRRKSD